MVRLSFVVPVLNEAAEGLAALAALQAARARGATVIVVDGGSSDNTRELALAHADQVLDAPRGRASQMNAGAAWAMRHWKPQVLCFVHADTVVPLNIDHAITSAIEGGAEWGRFDVSIAGPHPALRMIAWAMNLRSRLTRICTGDQALFVRTAAWRRLGGYAPQALMEDIELSQRLREFAFVALRDRVHTSGRRWLARGVWRTMVLMWRMRWQYWRGAAPEALARAYGYRVRPGAAIAVMAKAPIAGFAKTRLIPALGAASAARAQAQLLRAQLRECFLSALGPVRLWCAPDATHRAFRAAARVWPRLVLHNQVPGDLGVRMNAAMDAHFTKPGAPPWIVVGTDCPGLTAERLQTIADGLQTHDAVLVPAEDGGYVALGLARPVARVFDGIAWSTDQVAETTRTRLREAGARTLELPALWDVDDIGDWERWMTPRQ
jgi:rSAM/selenodomain-associated transferase 2/rSAM/selenodomain-associated transferase 1